MASLVLHLKVPKINNHFIVFDKSLNSSYPIYPFTYIKIKFGWEWLIFMEIYHVQFWTSFLWQKYFTKLKINKTGYEYDMPSTHLIFNFIITKIIVAIGLKAFDSLNRSYFENLFFFGEEIRICIETTNS